MSRIISKCRGKMHGRYRETVLVPKSKFGHGSFRWKKVKGGWLMVGCPKGHWSIRSQRCAVGTRAHAKLRKLKGEPRCRKG